MSNGNPALTSLLIREREGELARDSEINRPLRDHRLATERFRPAPAALPTPWRFGLGRLTRRALTRRPLTGGA